MKKILLLFLFILIGCASIEKNQLESKVLNKFSIHDEQIIYVKNSETDVLEKFGCIESVGYVDMGPKIYKVVEVKVDNILQLSNVKEFILFMYLTDKTLLEVKVRYI